MAEKRGPTGRKPDSAEPLLAGAVEQYDSVAQRRPDPSGTSSNTRPSHEAHSYLPQVDLPPRPVDAPGPDAGPSIRPLEEYVAYPVAGPPASQARSRRAEARGLLVRLLIRFALSRKADAAALRRAA